MPDMELYRMCTTGDLADRVAALTEELIYLRGQEDTLSDDNADLHERNIELETENRDLKFQLDKIGKELERAAEHLDRL